MFLYWAETKVSLLSLYNTPSNWSKDLWQFPTHQSPAERLSRAPYTGGAAYPASPAGDRTPAASPYSSARTLPISYFIAVKHWPVFWVGQLYRHKGCSLAGASRTSSRGLQPASPSFPEPSQVTVFQIAIYRTFRVRPGAPAVLYWLPRTPVWGLRSAAAAFKFIGCGVLRNRGSGHVGWRCCSGWGPSNLSSKGRRAGLSPRSPNPTGTYPGALRTRSISGRVRRVVLGRGWVQVSKGRGWVSGKLVDILQVIF